MTTVLVSPMATACPIPRQAAGNYLPFHEERGDEPILIRWRKLVAQLSTHPALVTDQATVTYGQIDQQATQIARAILAIKPQPSLVALLFIQGSNPIGAMMGVLKANLAYVALNATLPPVQLRTQLTDSRATVIVTDQAHMSLAEELADQGQQILTIDALSHVDEIPLPTQGKADDALLAIYYTSGSTGEPKGVMVPHGSFWQDAKRCAFCYELHFTDRVALIHEWSYMMGTRLIFSTLLNGATIYLRNPIEQNNLLLPQWLAEQQITILHLPIPLFRHLAQDESVVPIHLGAQLAFIVIGGMKLQWCDVERFVQRFGCTAAQIEFGYGMTEAGRVALQWLCSSNHHATEETLLAGYATIGNELLILDEQGQPLPPNQIGEVAVRSNSLALGYWQQPILTAARFCTDETGKRLFLTGDIGRLHYDGKLEILGRKDDMVKVRGYRIVLSAIEVALLQLDAVKEAAVLAPEAANGERRLIAYLVTVQPQPKSSELYQQLHTKLADHELPSHYVFLDTFPKTISGKIDYQALPQPTRTRALDIPFVAPRTALEQTLAKLWAEVLATDNMDIGGSIEIGIDDNFFMLGGHSLHAMTLMTKVEQEFGKRPRLHAFFAEPTIAHLARLITEEPQSPVTAYSFDTSTLSQTQRKAIQEIRAQLADVTQTQQRRPNLYLERWHRRRKAIHTLLNTLPFPLTVRLLRGFANVAQWQQHFFGKEVALTKHFLATIGYADEQEEALAKNLLWNLLDYYAVAPEQPAAQVLTVESKALLSSIKAKGKGLILARFHDVAPRHLELPGWPSVIVVGGIHNFLAHHRIDDALLANSLLSQLLDRARVALQTGGMIQIVPDGHRGFSQASELDFCGRRRPFWHSFAELALLTDAPVVVAVRAIDDDGRIQVKLIGPLDAGDESMSHAERRERLVTQYVELLRQMWFETPWLVPWYQMKRHLAYPPVETDKAAM